jgi:outer membrane protein assembly factor BamC
MSRIFKTTSWLLCFTVLGGCSGIDEYDTRIQYKKSTTTSPLELPPDLMATAAIEDQLVIPNTATYSDYETAQGHSTVKSPITEHVLPQADNVQLQHKDQTSWLVVQNTPEIVWSQAKNFLLDQGFNLSLENPQIGILETGWAENRADIPQDGLRRLFGGALDFLYSAPTRDKYRIRLERGQTPNTTEIYLTHTGVKEVGYGENTFAWEDRPSNPELEAEMLKRLMVYLGVTPKANDTQIVEATVEPADTETFITEKIQLFKTPDGQTSLLVDQSHESVWRYVGLALDRLGLLIEDRNREQGTYFVRYLDLEKEKPGVLDSWFGEGANNPDQEYQIHLNQEQTGTRITMLDKAGKVDTSKSAREIITLLHEQLSQSTPLSKD